MAVLSMLAVCAVIRVRKKMMGVGRRRVDGVASTHFELHVWRTVGWCHEWFGAFASYCLFCIGAPWFKVPWIVGLGSAATRLGKWYTYTNVALSKSPEILDWCISVVNVSYMLFWFSARNVLKKINRESSGLIFITMERVPIYYTEI